MNAESQNERWRHRRHPWATQVAFFALLLFWFQAYECQSLPSGYRGAWKGNAVGSPKHNIHISLYGGKVGDVVGMEVAFGKEPNPFSCVAGYTLKVVKPSLVKLEEGPMFEGAFPGGNCEFGTVILKTRRDGNIDYAWESGKRQLELVFSSTAVLSPAQEAGKHKVATPPRRKTKPKPKLKIGQNE